MGYSLIALLLPQHAACAVVLGACGWYFLGEIQPGGAPASQVSRRSIVWGQGESLVHSVLGLQVLPVIGGGLGSFWVVCLLAPVPL